MTDISTDWPTRTQQRTGIDRSGIPSTDGTPSWADTILNDIFPVDSKTKRTHPHGLHLWYQVKFDENYRLQEAARQLSQWRNLKGTGQQPHQARLQPKNRQTEPGSLQRRAATQAE